MVDICGTGGLEVSNKIFLQAKDSLDNQIEYLINAKNTIPPLSIIYNSTNGNGKSFAMAVDRLCREYGIPTILFRVNKMNKYEKDFIDSIQISGLPVLIVNPLDTEIEVLLYQDLDVSCRKNKLTGEYIYVKESEFLVPLFPAVVEAIYIVIKEYASSTNDSSKKCKSVYVNNHSVNVGIPLASSLFINGFAARNHVDKYSRDETGVIVSATGKSQTKNIMELFEHIEDRLFIDVGSRIVNGKLVGDIDDDALIERLKENGLYVSPKEIGTLNSMIIIKRFLERIEI